MTEISRGDAPVSRRSRIRSPGGCLGDRLRRAIDRSPQMASPPSLWDPIPVPVVVTCMIIVGGEGRAHRDSLD